MTRPLRCFALLALVVLFPAAAARADAPPGLLTYPTEIVARPLTLPRGVLEADLGLGMNLSYESVFQPLYPGIALHYAFTDSLELSGDFVFCANGLDGCASAANNGGVHLAFSLLRSGVFDAALFAGFDFASFSPGDEQVPLGARLRLTIAPDAFAIVVTPRVNIALNDRGNTNFDTMSIPLALQFQLTRHFEMQLDTGLNVYLDPPGTSSVGDSATIPVGLGATYSVNNQFDFGGTFTFVNLLGRATTFPQGFDYRTARVFVALRF